MRDIETEVIEVSDLPWNYLPQALIEAQDKTTGFFQLFPTMSPKIESKEGATFTVGSEDFRSPAKLSEIFSKKGMTDQNPYFVAPKTEHECTMAVAPDPTKASDETAKHGETITIVGLIDFGIAFWNKRFCERAFADKFLDIGFLSFDARGHNPPLVNFMGRFGINQYGTVLSTQGEAHLIEQLGNNFPQSVFAPSSLTANGGPPFQPRNVNHGTAMADLACGANADDVKLIAIELPSNVVLDSTGANLTMVAGLALESLVSRAAELAAGRNLKLKVLFPFGFSGGPQDGTHPVALQIQRALAQYPHIDISLMIPMGNQRQDQIHAEFGAIAKGASSKPLYWFIEPDDESANSFDLFIEGSSEATFRLVSPFATHFDVSVQDGLFYWICMDGDIIGAVHCSMSTNGSLRIRVSLRSPKSQIELSGAWQVQVAAKDNIVNASLWILRDFAPYYGRARINQRPSRFFDENYVEFDDDGLFRLEDTTGSLVQRNGSASVLATVPNTGVASVGSQEKRGNAIETAFYSGAFKSGHATTNWVLVDPNGPASGQLALGNGTPRMFKVTGTSVATALS